MPDVQSDNKKKTIKEKINIFICRIFGHSFFMEATLGLNECRLKYSCKRCGKMKEKILTKDEVICELLNYIF